MSRRASKPLLAVDIGNTSIALALFHSPERPEVLGTAKIALSSRPLATAFISSLKRLLRTRRDASSFDAIVSSVVPSVTRTILPDLKTMADRTINVRPQLDFGLNLAVDNPKAVGSDRIANAVAAQSLVHSSTAVVDCGSATTLSLIHDGFFLGGAILPGIRIMRDSLREKTAKLPRVPLTLPSSAIGRNTTAAIQSGVLIGTVEAITGIIRRAEKERAICFTVVLTGGHAELLMPLFQREIIHMPELTFQGLRLLFRANT